MLRSFWEKSTIFLISPFSFVRSKSDLAAKTTEKIGKGLKTLKQGVMVKSMEGLVDPLDPAYDLADMCVSI
jgi:hypothetical protein